MKKEKHLKKQKKNTSKTKQVLTKDMTLGEIMQKKPEAAQMLSGMGLGCVGCHFSAFDTLENGANIHGMDVNEILDELNNN